MTFSDLPPVLGEALAERGFAEPTAVQSAILEPQALGRDLIVSAQTGSGKTVAFGLAMASELLANAETAGEASAPRALVVAPTRELALQVSRELIWLYGKAGVRVATCVGGMDASKERRNLRHGAHIVVGTPGRLRYHIEYGVLDLSALRVAVLDEADEMLDMGFREDLEFILNASSPERRTLLFSATMPRPIVALATRYQRDALRISTVGDDRGHGDIAYQVVSVSPVEIDAAVVNLLRFHEPETAILFCATRDNVRRLHATLQDRGFAVVALSGEHTQTERNQALQALRDRRVSICVATDVAARGIDLPSLSLVVHVDIPRDADTLQHRSGRTGRAGRKGAAVLIAPHHRRKRVQLMLRDARIDAQWLDAPTPEAIRAQDRERLMTALLAPVEFEEEDRLLAARLLAERPAEDIAAMLVHARRAAMPQPEEILSGPGARPAVQREMRERPERAPRHEAREHDAPPHKEGPKERREGFDDAVWFRLNLGHRHHAEPRWILPLLCQRGEVTRNEIGAIRVGARETWFQIPASLADRFGETLLRTAQSGGDNSNLVIERSDVSPRDIAREQRHAGPKHHAGKPRKGHPRPVDAGGQDRPRRKPEGHKAAHQG